jgi:TRAP transporter TAXI family solute receptor
VAIRLANTAGKRSSKAGRLKLWGPAALITIAAFAATPWLIGPSCPKHIVIATGSTEGSYFAYAEQYREILARDGITLEVKSTAGSIENIGLLKADESGVSLAIVQGGTADDPSAGRIQSLASLYHEPIWVFSGTAKRIERLTTLQRERVAIGAEGSGTRAVALVLLRENGLIAADPSAVTTEPLGGRQAADALKRGDIDAAFFVISPTSPIVRELLQTPGIELASFRRAAAYERNHPYLSSVTLAEGILDFGRNTPTNDCVLLAPTANLVARSDLHPALVPLLLKAIHEVHESGTILQAPGTFPSPKHVEYPLAATAGRYFQSGPTMLYRYLPFRAAAWVDQVKLILLPLCTLLLPFLKVAPPIYRWRIRSKIYRWYRVLREIDQKLKRTGAATDLAEEIAKLKRLDEELADVSVPLSYMEEFYNLRLHAAYVLQRLNQMQARRNPANSSRRVA